MAKFKIGDRVYHPKCPNIIFTVLEVRNDFGFLPWYTLTDGKNIWDTHCIDYKKVYCKNCFYWGYNNNQEMDSVGNSRCSNKKKKTFALQFCKKFKEKNNV